MPKKLKYFLDSSRNKSYTLKNIIAGKETLPAHYKFLKLRDAPKDNK
jgi:hypothetical protein